VAGFTLLVCSHTHLPLALPQLWEGLSALGLKPFVEKPEDRLVTVNTIKVRAEPAAGLQPVAAQHSLLAQPVIRFMLMPCTALS